MSTIATVIPAYNAAAFIAETLESVASQTHLPEEIIVVDDGSTDGTIAAVEKSAAAHPELKIQLIRQPNAGASAARNAGIHAAHSEIIAFVDADDVLESMHHEVLLRGLLEDRSVIAVFGDQSIFSGRTEKCASFLSGKPHESLPYEVRDGGARVIQDGLWGALIRGNFVSMSASMTYRQVAMDIGGFDTGLMTSEDRDFWLRVSRNGRFAYVPRRLARIREHASNLSGAAHASMVARYAFDVVMKQVRNRESLRLDDGERALLASVLEDAARDLLYVASKGGWNEYRAARAYLRDCTPELLRWDLRGWCRAIGAGRILGSGCGR
ncbi:MAG: glycosyltransferase family 2 protein [Spiribacter salinus]|uniref:Glycosyltransferase family 2 protein n=1 Tax=Spiribacter salinus TaxID=1335746 RepID=A0A540VS86_9GAMM|nr:MAG: glycosyltransferase family 2 protein [Spiribacter salinus]